MRIIFMALIFGLLIVSCKSDKENANERYFKASAEWNRAIDVKKSYEPIYLNKVMSGNIKDSIQADSTLNAINLDIKKLQTEMDSLLKISKL